MYKLLNIGVILVDFMEHVSENIKRGLELAKEFRSKYVSDGKIGVDINDAVKSFCEDIGVSIKLASADLSRLSMKKGKEISGVMINSHGNIYIYVNKSDSPTRKRFTIAHELGHIYKDYVDEIKLKEIEKVNFRMAWCDGEEYFEEQLANAFASEILMPTEQVEYFLKAGDTLYDMANKFGVSYQAMYNKINKLSGF